MARAIVDPPVAGERRLRMSYDEFLAWVDDDTHAEWVDGEVTVFMPPTRAHQRLDQFLAGLLGLYVRLLGLGEVLTAPFEMRLVPGRLSREPDLLFVANAHADLLTEQRLDGPADLVVEIVSAHSVSRDRRQKLTDYQSAGIPEYWTIDARPRRQRADFLQLTPEGTYRSMPLDAAGRYHSAVLPGFWLDPAWLWQEPLPDPEPLVAAIAPAARRELLRRLGVVADPAADDA